MTAMQIRDATLADAEAVCHIYNPYIRDTIISFEETEVSAEEMRARMASVMAEYPWLMAERDGAVLGYAYAGRWQERVAYRHSALVSVYVSMGATGRGIGTQLYRALFERLRALPVHVVLGGISLPNAASVALHEKFGFEKVAHFPEVGFKFGRWIDVGYWQCRL
jgi:phosphinothricin acetyltransferase